MAKAKRLCKWKKGEYEDEMEALKGDRGQTQIRLQALRKGRDGQEMAVQTDGPLISRAARAT